MTAARLLADILAAARSALAAGDFMTADDLVRPALRDNPRDPNLLFMAGTCQMARGDDAGAEEKFRSALLLAPGYVPALINLGCVLRAQHRLGPARQVLERAVAREPTNTAAWITLVGSYVNEGESAMGEIVARQALARCPDSPDLRWNLSLLLLEQGKWEEGWREYRHRFASTAVRQPAYARGRESPPRLAAPVDVTNGQTVLCHGEQGLGDEILFASMLHELIDDVGQQGGRVLLDCHPRLRRVFSRSFPIEIVSLSSTAGVDERPAGRLLDGIDWICPIGDLGGFYRRSRVTFPEHRGYLRVDRDRVGQLREHLLRDFGNQPLVGIAWSGGSPKTHGRYRHIPLTEWLPVLKQPCGFVSLQYQDDASDIGSLRVEHGIDILRLPHITQHRDYGQTFHLVAALDLVITVPTSVLHVAGACGTPCWVVMDERAAWREADPGDVIPWYPATHRRFRRAVAETDWSRVLDEVANCLCSVKPAWPILPPKSKPRSVR